MDPSKTYKMLFDQQLGNLIRLLFYDYMTRSYAQIDPQLLLLICVLRWMICPECLRTDELPKIPVKVTMVNTGLLWDQWNKWTGVWWFSLKFASRSRCVPKEWRMFVTKKIDAGRSAQGNFLVWIDYVLWIGIHSLPLIPSASIKEFKQSSEEEQKEMMTKTKDRIRRCLLTQFLHTFIDYAKICSCTFNWSRNSYLSCAQDRNFRRTGC